MTKLGHWADVSRRLLQRDLATKGFLMMHIEIVAEEAVKVSFEIKDFVWLYLVAGFDHTKKCCD